MESTCYLENDEDEDGGGTYTFEWISFGPGGNRTLSRSKDLRMTNVNADSFRDPIYCIAKRVEDGESFQKQINVRYCKIMHELSSSNASLASVSLSFSNPNSTLNTTLPPPLR